MATVRKPQAPAQFEKKEPASPAAGKPPAERIAVRAYEIWQASGRPQGRDVECWLRAERELLAAKPGPR